MTYTEKILDLATNEETIRNYTQAEVASVEEAIKEGQAIAQEFADKALAKAAAQAKLAALGLTTDDLKALGL